MTDRGEVQEAFEHWWSVGNAGEDWAAWTELFVRDVDYLDHFWGPLHGHREVDTWIHAVMKGVPEIYGVYEWHAIDGDRVVFHYQNRRDNPSEEGAGAARRTSGTPTVPVAPPPPTPRRASGPV